ncbi:ribosomal protein L1p/L10e family-domain-containing protein [Lipomyces arxii]|uniref:ribosomal protein L1p/L10e family-domain-containing protein n=1 Tax=Lipomyces arxii TaxID=56418 RepID=UPI0034CF7911
MPASTVTKGKDKKVKSLETSKTKTSIKSAEKAAKPQIKKSRTKTSKASAEKPVSEEEVVSISSNDKLSLEQTEKAIIALLKYLEKKTGEEEAASLKDSSKKRKLNLLSDDPSDPKQLEKQALYLVVGAKKFFSDKLVMKPKRITIPHPIYSEEQTSICLFTKDPQRLYKDVLLNDDNSLVKDSISRIVGVSKLKTKFKTYEARRQLRDEHDLFLADDRVITLMPGLLGKSFIGGKKLPIAISLLSASASAGNKTAQTPSQKKRKSDIKPEEAIAREQAAISTKRVASEIKRTLNSAMVVLPAGNSTAVKFGYSTFTVDDLVENINVIVEGLTKNIVKGGWSGIRSLHLKTQDSISLPIYLTGEL